MRRKAAPLTALMLLIIAASAVLLSSPITVVVAQDPAPDETKTNSEEVECKTNDDETCANPAKEEKATHQLSPTGERLITSTELAFHGIKSTESKEAATAGGHTIWLSILGRVYDVTSGGPSFYGPKGSYNFYSGRDASPCFHSGKNNEEGAAEKLEEWTDDKHLMSVYDWSLFYEKHETYEFMGVLVDSKYYDENGEETDVRKDIVERASKAKEIADRQKEERRKARLEKRKANMKK